MPEETTSAAIDTRPGQRSAVERLMRGGQLVSYAVTADQTCVLSIFEAEDEAALLEMASLMPIARHADLNIVELDNALTPAGMVVGFSKN